MTQNFIDFVKVTTLGHSVQPYFATDGISKIWYTNREDLTETKRVYLVDCSTPSVTVTKIGLSEVWEYDTVTKVSTVICRRDGTFINPVTMAVELESQHADGCGVMDRNEGPDGFLGTLGHEIKTDQLPEATAPEIANGLTNKGWTSVAGREHGALTFFNGSLYIMAQWSTSLNGALDDYDFLALWRYENTESDALNSWTKVYEWPRIDDRSAGDASLVRRLMSTRKGSTSPQALVLIARDLASSDFGEVNYAASANLWNPLLSSVSGLDFAYWTTQEEPYKHQDLPPILDFPADATPDRVNLALDFDTLTINWSHPTTQIIPSPHQGNAFWRQETTSGPSYFWRIGGGGTWVTGGGAIRPLLQYGFNATVGTTISGSDVRLFAFQPYVGTWDADFGFVTVTGGGGENNGAMALINVGGTLYMWVDASGHGFGTQADLIYTVSLSGLGISEVGEDVGDTGLYTTSFNPNSSDIHDLKLARSTYWDGIANGQRLFQVSRTDDRIYLGNPNVVPSGGTLIARYTPGYGGFKALTADEDITDTLTTLTGVNGVDLTDRV